MIIQRKILSGFMNLDDPKDTLPGGHHKEAKNGVFRGNSGTMKFQTIKGNQKITNTNLKTNTR
jgi:hypothetical protein